MKWDGKLITLVAAWLILTVMLWHVGNKIDDVKDKLKFCAAVHDSLQTRNCQMCDSLLHYYMPHVVHYQKGYR